MILLVAVAAAAITVPLLGGSLFRLATLRITWPATIAVALGLQVLIVSLLPRTLMGAPAEVLHVVSYGLALAFLWRNRRIPWLWLVGIGGLANLVAIGANNGVMPASRTAFGAAGRSAGAGFHNSAATPHEHLPFLGDIFSIPHGWPLANVFSPGDVILVIGVIALLHEVGDSRLARLRRHRRPRHHGRSAVTRRNAARHARIRSQVFDSGNDGYRRAKVMGIPRTGPTFGRFGRCRQ